MHNKNQFSKIVIDYWQGLSGTKSVFKNNLFTVFVNEKLDKEYQVMTLEFPEKHNWIIIRPELFERLRKEDLQVLNFEGFIRRLQEHGIFLHGVDNIFYYPKEEKEHIKNLVIPENIRTLTSEDADYFSEFEASATAQDLDDAFVALDHWKVYGVFEEEKLVAVASMYPWCGNLKIADIGVITLPKYRRQGLAKKLVLAISQSALLDEFQPQYRCQSDNLSSLILAKKLNMNLFVLWNVDIQDAVFKQNTLIH